MTPACCCQNGEETALLAATEVVSYSEAGKVAVSLPGG